MRGWAAFPYMFAGIALGVVRAPLWVPIAFAVIGVGLGFWIVPNVGPTFARSRQMGVSAVGELLIGLYLMQLLFAAALYGVGRLARAIF